MATHHGSYVIHANSYLNCSLVRGAKVTSFQPTHARTDKTQASRNIQTAHLDISRVAVESFLLKKQMKLKVQVGAPSTFKAKIGVRGLFDTLRAALSAFSVAYICFFELRGGHWDCCLIFKTTHRWGVENHTLGGTSLPKLMRA